MSSLFEPYLIVNAKNTDGTATIDANEDVAAWIWSQPADKWASAGDFTWPYHRYYVTQELHTMIALKWTV